MKIRFFSYLLISMFFLAACGGSEEPSATTTLAPPSLKVTVSEALVFNIPSREATVLFRLIEGDQAPIFAQTPPDQLGVIWYQVAQGDEFGWVAGSQVQVSGDLALARTVSESVWAATSTPVDIAALLPTNTPSSTPITPEALAAFIQADQLPVYDQPNREATQTGELTIGEQVDLLGQSELAEDLFFLVGQNQSVLGWVAAEGVDFTGDLTRLPILDDVNTSLEAFLPEITPQFTATSFVTATPIIPTATLAMPVTVIPSQTPHLAGTSQAAPTATPLQLSPTPAPSATGDIEIGVGIEPAIEIVLPEDWQAIHISVPINSVYLQGQLPVSVYRGALTPQITGTIWVIWAFPNVTSPSGEINLYADGIQLLRGVLFDAQACNMGLGNQPYEYQIGTYTAIGTIYSAVDCGGDETDIAGFFGVVQVNNINYAFFTGVEPVDQVEEATPALYELLKTVTFRNLTTNP